MHVNEGVYLRALAPTTGEAGGLQPVSWPVIEPLAEVPRRSVEASRTPWGHAPLKPC